MWIFLHAPAHAERVISYEQNQIKIKVSRIITAKSANRGGGYFTLGGGKCYITRAWPCGAVKSKIPYKLWPLRIMTFFEGGGTTPAKYC